MSVKSVRKERFNPHPGPIVEAHAPRQRQDQNGAAEQSHKRRRDFLEMSKEAREWLALGLSFVSLLLSLFGLGKWSQTKNELQDQKGQLERLENCQEKEIGIEIEPPEGGLQVRASSVEIGGTSTLHEQCRYVFLIVRGVSNRSWNVADLVQVNRDGRWNAMANLDRAGVRAGEQFEVDARVTAQPSVYRIGQILPTPAQRGVPSNIIRLRRLP